MTGDTTLGDATLDEMVSEAGEGIRDEECGRQEREMRGEGGE